MTVRERSRLRPQLLERMGWRYMPLWTIEVFTDPSACADRISGYLGLEKPAAPSRVRPSPGFSDDIENLSVEDGQDAYAPAAAAGANRQARQALNSYLQQGGRRHERRRRERKQQPR